ncbi:MAG: hypothetical protein IT384_07970 [Deltaproteobacteria bacterium]|nr:hypothetical protein [Deltaproteobacteria bacterium]
MTTSASKISWSGTVISVQPRIRLLRSFDQRSHSYLGYVLRLRGRLGDEDREFSVAIGEGAHEKHQFRAGDVVSGDGAPVGDPRSETADLYKIAKLKIAQRGPAAETPPPWRAIAPALPVYRERGHRRLDARTYAAKCASCIWGCRMPVEMIIDQWNPTKKQYREETFCYGPLSCPLYKAGPTRKVPGRKGMSWEEEDWVDEDAVAHRGPDG